MKNAKRTIGIGVVVWLLFFGWWFKDYLYLNWRFDLFSLKSWRFVIGEFRAGWRLSNTGDWIFLISFIVSGPLFCLFWYLANKIFWLSIFKRSYRYTKRTIHKMYQKEPEYSYGMYPKAKPAPVDALGRMQRPVKMASSSGGVGMMNPMPKAQPFSMAPVQNTWTPPQTKDPVPAFPVDQPYYHTEGDLKEIAETPLSEVQLPQIETVNEDISGALAQSGYRVFENILWSEKKLDWLGVSNKQIWVALYDDETGDWLADEEAFNDEDPLWFSETDHRVSPVFELKQIQKQIQTKLGDSEIKVQPVLIERRGNLINAEDMLKAWNDLGVIVCRTEVGGPVELPTVGETLKDKQEAVSEPVLQKISEIFNLGEKVNV